MDKISEDALANFAQEQEKNTQHVQIQEDPKPKVKKSKIDEINEIRAEREEVAKEYAFENGIGWLTVPVDTLPTQGLFYPDGTKLLIRAATGAEIRHWSTIDDSDLASIDDALSYVLERCLKIKFPDGMGLASWKDLKEIDRFYIILCIRDFTFTEGTNDLKIAISEGYEITVHKDDIEFMDIDQKLMNHYNPEKKCFSFPIKGKNTRLNVYLPSCGVSQWLKGYIQRKAQLQQGFDEDFVKLAPMLISDYRGLDDFKYEEYLRNTTSSFGAYEYSLLAKIRSLIESSIDPKIKYTDKDGVERVAPLNFRGGLQSIFLLDMDDIL